MKTKANSLSVIGSFLLWACLLVEGCADSTSLVRVTRRGGIALDSSMVLAMGNITGDQEKEFRRDLRKALRANSDFNMLDDAGGKEIMSDSLSELLAPALSENKQALVVITGAYRANTDDQHKVRDGPNNTKKQYIVRTFTGRFSFTLTDLTKHSLSFSREIQESSTDERDDNWLLNTIVDAVVTDPHYEEVRKKVIDAFIYELYPHDEVYQVKFLKDPDFPELENGIAYANIGQWDKAIELFKSVVDKYPHNEKVHKAYYDLGISYKWNNKFPEARENLEKAYLLTKSSDYFDEIQTLKQFEQDYQIRQNEQSPPQQR